MPRLLLGHTRLDSCHRNIRAMWRVSSSSQSDPLVSDLCNPFNVDLSGRSCSAGEVEFQKATQ
ncbi:hypothetical protein AKJ16_DCAP24218, partial [Drosera capensis]